MKAKKFTALVLAACLGLSAGMAGCSSTSASSSAAAGSAAAGSAAAGSAAASSVGSDPIEVSMLCGADEGIETAAVTKAIKTKFNITLKYQQVPSDYDTKVSTLVASNSLPDIVTNLDIKSIIKYGAPELFACLDDYRQYAKDYFGLIEADDRKLESAKMQIDGKMYCFKKLERYRIAIMPGVHIRMDLLKEQNIATPTSWDELYAALLKIKAKHPDMYGFSTRQGTNFMLGQYAYPLGSGGLSMLNTERGIYYEPKSDSYVYGPASTNFKRVVEFMRKAYADGLLDPDYTNMTNDAWKAKLSNGQLMMANDNTSFIARRYNPALKEINADAYFDVLEPMKNADGDKRAYRYTRDWTGKNTVINKTSKNIDRIVTMMNWLYTKEGADVSNFGELGTDYTMVNGYANASQTLLDSVKDKDDPFNALEDKIGGGLFNMGHYIDESFQRQMADPIIITEGDNIDKWTKSGEISYMKDWPVLTEDETEKVAVIEKNLSTVFDQAIDGFIQGKTPMTDWDKLVEQLKAQKSAELEQIFNDAYKRSKK